MIIDQSFIDVDFTKFSQYVRGDNGRRPLRARQTAYREALAAGGQELIPEKEWPSLSEKNESEKAGLEWLVKWILNQRNEGSCVGFATTQGHQVIQGKTFGLDNVIHLSGVSLYQLIGRSPNSGSSIDDALDVLRRTGVIPLDTPENRQRFGSAVMPENGFYNKRPAGVDAVAAKFRGVEYLVCESVEEMATALFSGHPVVVGRAGHSILYLGIVYSNGRLYALYVNSWGEWGQAAGHHQFGFGLDSLSYVRSSANWCWALRTIVDPGIYSIAA